MAGSTDGQGRTVDFKNTIVIMTSNLGSPIIQEYFMDGHTDKSSHQVVGQLLAAGVEYYHVDYEPGWTQT